MPISTRHAQLEDYQGMINLIRSCTVVDSVVDSFNNFSESLYDKSQFPQMAIDMKTGKVVGILTKVAYFSGYGHLARLLVHPDYRRRGIGYSLVVAAESALRNAGAVRISVHIDPANVASVKLFEKAGFKEIDRKVYDKDFRTK